MPPETTTSLFSMSDRAPHPPGMNLGMRVHPGLHPGAPQAEKMEWFSCFSLLSGLLQPGIIPDFVQETQLSPCFENLVRTWIKLWGNYMDCLGQAHPFYTACLTWAMMDSSEIISFLHPVLKKYLYSHTSLKSEPCAALPSEGIFLLL